MLDSYESGRQKKALNYTQPSFRRRGDIIFCVSWMDCRCNVEKSMRPPFYGGVSSSGFVGIFRQSVGVIYSVGPVPSFHFF